MGHGAWGMGQVLFKTQASLHKSALSFVPITTASQNWAPRPALPRQQRLVL